MDCSAIEQTPYEGYWCSSGDCGARKCSQRVNVEVVDPRVDDLIKERD